MEKLSFSLGVASVLVVLTGIVITWVTFKVKKLIKFNENLERYISEIDRNINYRIDRTEHNYSDEIKEIYETFHRQTDDSYSDITQQVNQNHDQMVELHNNTMSYIDSRIDKLINNPKFCLNKEKELLTD